MTMLDAPGRTGSRKQHAKTERIEARASATEKEVIQRAADLEGRTVSEFIVARAYEAAQIVIRDQETMTLSARDSREFVEALLNPLEPNSRLSAAFDAFQREISRGTVQRR
jgi:uncharacterized protein (DUF1778 family)